MRIARARTRLLALTAAAALAGGCGSGPTDPAAPASPAATVDVSQLDPGNYPVVPRQITTMKPDISVGDVVQEAIRLGEHVPLPLEIDERLGYGSGGSAITADYPPMGIDGFNDRAPGLVAGWQTGGRHRYDVSLGLNVHLTVLRFGKPAQAATAADFLASQASPEYPDKGPVQIPGYPAARAALTSLEWVRALYPQGEYLYWLHVEDDLTVPDGPAFLMDVAKRMLDKATESMRDYRPTPPDQLAGLLSDPDDLLSRVLPAGKGQVRASEGLYGPHAALTHDDRPAASRRAYADAGIDVMASSLSNIYRTKDDAAAQRFIAAFADELLDRYKPVDPPPGLATARCLQLKDVKYAIGAKFMCYLPYQRYVAEVYADQSQDLRQRLSAQYQLLAYGHI
ncbi:hypothetical protein ACFRAQ_20430 [Nocardia sp. NPDC056611]|uniref:DUF7373 family lipoprotein n=1 Tax=Nocardia sp. NPDC056611 TaxID=3345877 RepID=UPI00366D387B